MIFPFFRNDTVKIVVPNNRFRQRVTVEESKNLLERCQRITPFCRPGRREAASRYQAADFWIRPFSAKRTASSRSAVVRWEPRSCNWATKRIRNMPRFSIGKPPAAAQIARSCESDKAIMPSWSCWGDGCQLFRSGCDGPGRRKAAAPAVTVLVATGVVAVRPGSAWTIPGLHVRGVAQVFAGGMGTGWSGVGGDESFSLSPCFAGSGRGDRVLSNKL
jgi:hypothetical protein